MGQSLTNGYDVVAVVNEIELQRSIRQQFMEGLARFGLPAELLLPIDGAVFEQPGIMELFGRLGLPDSRLRPLRNTIDAFVLANPETYPNAIEIKIPFGDSALIGEAVGFGGLNFTLSLIFDLARVSENGDDEGLGVDPDSLIVWLEVSRTDPDPDRNNLTTRQKLAILLPDLNPLTWPLLEQNLADALKTQPFVSDLTSALPGLEAGACAVTNASPGSTASFDIPSTLQCFDFEIVSDPNFQISLAIKGMLTGASVSSTVGTPTDPLSFSWAKNSDRAVVIVSNDFMLNEALPRSLMAALLDPLLTANEDDIRDEVEDDDEIAAADREDEIDRRTEEMRQQTAEEHFRLRPFSMLRTVARNFRVPLKPEGDEDRNDTFIDRASIASVPDLATPGSTVFRASFHATGGVPGVYNFDADISVLIRFTAAGGQVEPEIEAEENPRVDVEFENVAGVIAGVVALITGAFTFGIGAIVTFIAYHLLQLLAGGIASAFLPGAVDENLGEDVNADLPNALSLVVREVEQDDLLLRAELALRDNDGIQWVGITPATTDGFRLDLDHGSPTAGFPDLNQRFDAFTGVPAADADVDLVGRLVRARNGARLFDFGQRSLGRALNVVQGDIRGRSGNGVGSIQLQNIADFTSVATLAIDDLEQHRGLAARVIGVVTNEGRVARLIFVSGGSVFGGVVTGALVTRCVYRRYRQELPGVRMGLTLQMSDERRSGVMSDEVTVEVTFPTDIGRGIDIGGFDMPAGFRDRPTEVVVRVGSEVRERAFEGKVNMSTTLLLRPFRSIVWSVVDRAGVEQTIAPGGPREFSVPTDADITLTVGNDSRVVDFASQLGQSGNFLVRVRVTDYRGTVATDEIVVQFFGSRFFTSGFDRVRDLIDLDTRLRAREEGLVPGGRGPQPDPSPESPFGDDGLPTKDSPPTRDGRPTPGQPRRREMVRRSTKASLDRREFNASDPRPALLRHLTRRSRQANHAKSEAVIEQAVAEWTNTILGLPDALTLMKRHPKQPPKPIEDEDEGEPGCSPTQEHPDRPGRGRT